MNDISIVWDLNDVLFKNFKMDLHTFEFVKQLKNIGIDQYVCTNTMLWRLEHYKRKYLIQNYFLKIYSTKEMGLSKTDPKVFLKIKEEISKKIVIIDDKEKNLIIPKSMGAYTIKYIDDNALKEEFKLLKIFE